MTEMEVKQDTDLILVKAKTFPDGVVAAYQELEKAIGNPKGREFYGISRGDRKGIVYWAGVKPTGNEAARPGFEKFKVVKGTYLAELLTNWRGREMVLGETFQKMLQDPRIDPQGSCVEWYQDNGDVICMVRIIPER